ATPASGHHPVRLGRVRPRTVLTAAAGTLAVHVLLTQLSSVNVLDALTSARPDWLALALLGSALTYPGAALTLLAFVPVALPLSRTTLVQLASSFLTLISPAGVGHLAMHFRYLQRSGLPASVATTSIAGSQALTVAVTVVVLVVSSWLSGASGSRLALLPSGHVLAVLAAAAVVLALGAASPPGRRLVVRRVLPLTRTVVPQLVASASDPRRLSRAVLGVVLLHGGNVLALEASLHAFSTSLDLPTLVVVYLAAATIGSAAPTPGGLGAVEAATVGGLTTSGVPLTPALTAVLAFRTATFWLPALLGWVALTALQRRERV
ncbi:MAG: hypothetical protein JWN17_384, partial [Frankiales bacterium]|nr:hypothetical protein [Frankiales bacterium]